MVIYMPEIVSLAGNEIRVLVESENTGAHHYIYIDILDENDNNIATLRRPAVAQKAEFQIGRIFQWHYEKKFQYTSWTEVVENPSLWKKYKVKAYESIDFGAFQNFATSGVQYVLPGGLSRVVWQAWRDQNDNFYGKIIQQKRFLTWKPNPYYIPKQPKYEKIFFFSETVQTGVDLVKNGSTGDTVIWNGGLNIGLYELEIGQYIDENCSFRLGDSEEREYRIIDRKAYELIFRNSFGVYDTVHLFLSGYEREQYSESERVRTYRYNQKYIHGWEVEMLIERQDHAMMRYLTDFFNSPEVYMYAGGLIPVNVKLDSRTMRDNKCNILRFSIELEEDAYYSAIEETDIELVETFYITANPYTVLSSTQIDRLVWTG